MRFTSLAKGPSTRRFKLALLAEPAIARASVLCKPVPSVGAVRACRAVEGVIAPPLTDEDESEERGGGGGETGDGGVETEKREGVEIGLGDDLLLLSCPAATSPSFAP